MGCKALNRSRKPKISDKDKKRLKSYGNKLPQNYRVSKRVKKKPGIPAVLQAASEKEIQEGSRSDQHQQPEAGTSKDGVTSQPSASQRKLQEETTADHIPRPVDIGKGTFIV